MRELKRIVGILFSVFLIGAALLVAMFAYLVLYGTILAIPLLVVYYIFHALGVL